MLVGDILAQWRRALNGHLGVFAEEARRVSDWDARVRVHRGKIRELAAEVNSLKVKQREMSGHLQTMEAEQAEMDVKMAALERKVDQILEADPTSGHTSNSARMETYQLARRLDTQLNQMGDQLRVLAETVNERFARREDDRVEKVRQILAEHMRSMRWADTQADRLRSQIAIVQSALKEKTPRNR